LNILLSLSGFCLVLSWLIPTHFLPWASFYNECVAFIALVLLWLAKVREGKAFSLFLVVGLALIFLILLQYFLGTYFFYSDAVMAALYILGACAAYQLGLSCCNRWVFINGMAWLLISGGLISALLGIVQWLELGSQWVVSTTMGRSVGNLAQPNNYASLVFWSICASCFLYVKRTLSFETFCLISLVLVFGLVVSDSRTPLMQCLFFAILFFWGVRKGALGLRDMRALLPIGLYFLLYFSFPAIEAFVFVAEPGLLGLVERPYSYRVAIWTNLLLAIIESPVAGYGVGQVGAAQFTFLHDFGRTVELVEYSHNILVDLVIWFGPLFGCLLIGFFLCWIGRCLWRIQSAENWFLFSCIGSLVIHGFVEYPLAYAYFLLPFSLMLGLLDNGHVRVVNLVRCKVVYSVISFVSGLAFIFLIWGEYRALEEDHRLMRAQNIGLVEERDVRLADNVIVLNGKREYIRFARYPARKNMSAETLEWMKKLTYRYPFSAAIYRYSVALALNGREAEAHSELTKIQYMFSEQKYEYYTEMFRRSIELGVEQ
jgi:hypothetical protein